MPYDKVAVKTNGKRFNKMKEILKKYESLLEKVDTNKRITEESTPGGVLKILVCESAFYPDTPAEHREYRNLLEELCELV